MRLLVLTPEYLPTSGGGIVTFYRHLLPAVAKAGAQVTVLVGSAVSQPGGEVVIDGIRVLGLTADRFAATLQRFAHLAASPMLARHLAAAWAMREQAATLGEFDAVEAVDWGLSAAPWIVDPALPLLVRGHGSVAQIARHEPLRGGAAFDALLLHIERSLFDRCDFATYSRGNADDWTRTLSRDVAADDPALPYPSVKATAEAPWALVLARVQAWKGPHVMGEALEQRGDLPRVRWVGRDVPDAASGAPSTLVTMRARFPRAWRERIEHHGTVSAEQALTWVRAARFVVVPSTWDVFNFAGAEAMAAGAVVVASRGAGMAELIEEGRNGFAVPSGDAMALSEAMTRAAALDRQARERIGAAARETVAKRLDPAAAAQAAMTRWRAARCPDARADAADAILRPQDSKDGAHDFLSQYGLRPLLRHVAARLRHKAWRR